MAHGPAGSVPLRVRRLLALAAVVLAGVTGLGIAALWPRGPVESDVLGRIGFVRETHHGRVLSIHRVPCPGAGSAGAQEQGGAGGGGEVRCERLRIEILDGPDRGQLVSIESVVSTTRLPVEAGTEVVLARQADAQPGFEYALADVRRMPTLVWLAALFSVAVVVLGRLRGLAALAGLVATFVVLLRFVLPAILDGRSPLLVATVGAAAIAFLALYLAHGVGSMTTIALLGTLTSLALTALLGTVFVDLAKFTGFATEEASFLNLGAAQVDIAGLVLAGIVLGALGALDDMTVTQASAVFELRAANPAMTTRNLYRAGIRIGRDHVASTVNTLVLAYAGASLPLFLLFILSRQSLATVANSEVVATEIVRTLVGSIGLVVAVPVTTALAALSRPPLRRRPGSPAPTDEETPEPGPEEAGEEAPRERSFWLPDRRRDLWQTRRRR